MSYAAKSIVGFRVYALITGIALLFMPIQTLQHLGFEITNEHWIFIVGLLMMDSVCTMSCWE